jgi:glycosyltransferase involved in cell wall biosynthesis
MKLLWLSHFIPFPPRGGSRQRSFNLIRQISAKYETHLIALNMQGETPQRSEEYASELRRYCAEVQIWEPPYPWRGAQWWGQLAFSPFYRLHYGARALWSPALGQRWQSILDDHPGALVHFDSIDLAMYFPPAANFHKVLNHHNCESAMAERRSDKEQNPLKRTYLRQQSGKLKRLEQEVCHQFDVNLTVSELDAQTLKARNPHAECRVVENGTDTEYFHPSDAQTEPDTLVFAGGLSWYPNISGIRFFVREIWPLLKQQRPAIKLYLAGRSPAAAVKDMAQSDSAIELVPDPVDIRPWVWKASVFICPIIDGGGTRLKILDALALGKAVVSTTIGAEGLEVRSGEHLLVADEPQDFATQVSRLLHDDGLRRQLAMRGRSAVEKLYSWTVIGSHLEQAYKWALEQNPAG